MSSLPARLPAAAALLALAAATASGTALADGRRAHVGVHVATPGVAVHYGSRPYYRHAPRVYATPRYYGPSVVLSPWPAWGPPPVYYGPSWSGSYWYGPAYPPVVTVPSRPPVYIERGPDEGAPQAGSVPQAGTAPQGWWYWCNDPQGYHPDVAECPGGWMPVAPQPQRR